MKVKVGFPSENAQIWNMCDICSITAGKRYGKYGVRDVSCARGKLI
jgi:hypothetical protein